MAIKSKTSTIASPSYVDFEPYCEWKKEEGVETLVFHLPDFKRDQLRVQVNNLGVIKVSGERQTTADGTQRSRFLKETKIPQGCEINDIRAKFSGGHLHVVMPIKAAPPVQQQQQQQQKPEITSSSAPESEITQKPKAEALVPNSDNLKASSSENGKAGGTSTIYDNIFGNGSYSQGRLKVQKKVAVSLGVAVTAMVAIGAFVAYKYGSSPPSHIEE